jgi:AcrR family transcriptional regulator
VLLSLNERDTLKKICKAVVVQVDKSSRERILAATAEVLGRNGRTKLSLSEVATHAGVSRPTLYRWFASKKELLDAFSVWERQSYERTVAEVTAGLPDHERLDAVLRVIVEYQQSYPGLRMVDIEPAHVIKRLAQILPRRGRGDRGARCHIPLPGAQ